MTLTCPGSRNPLTGVSPRSSSALSASGIVLCRLRSEKLVSPRRRGLTNFSLLSLHKTMPLALKALLDLGETPVSGFLLPGHVSVITGTACYEFLARDYGVAGVVAGFEPHDVLEALLMLVRQREAAIDIEYTRAVQPEGNVVAQRLLEQVFEPSDADWRGLGVIPGSGLAIREEYAQFD